MKGIYNVGTEEKTIYDYELLLSIIERDEAEIDEEEDEELEDDGIDTVELVISYNEELQMEPEYLET